MSSFNGGLAAKGVLCAPHFSEPEALPFIVSAPMIIWL